MVQPGFYGEMPPDTVIAISTWYLLCPRCGKRLAHVSYVAPEVRDLRCLVCLYGLDDAIPS